MTDFTENDFELKIIDIFLSDNLDATPVKAEILDEFVVVEGDIIVATKANYLAAQSLNKGLIVTLPTAALWPDGIMKFQLAPDLEKDVRIINAMKHWSLKTGITFRVESDNTKDHVYFQKGTGCSSNLGLLRNGRQYITLSDACSYGTVIHEIGHSLGLLHEHTRGDRDKYVEVYYDNIKTDKVHNFEKRIDDAEIYGSYDFNSIMHYRKNAFSANGFDTIRTLNGEFIGNRLSLSQSDISTIKENYFQQELPCDYQTCDDPWDIELGEIIQSCVRQPYEKDIYLNNPLVISKAITKVRNLILSNDGRIEFDLNREVDERQNFHALIVEKLTIERVDGLNPELKFSWFGKTIFDILQGLAGELGKDAKPSTGKGSDGLPGLNGGRGKTKHAPAIFLFIKELEVPSDALGSINFHFLLRGLPGGEGGIGGKGSDGNRGKTGRSARNGSFGTCMRGGSDGKQGGNPGKGGKGGDAGCGGSGADLHVYFGDSRINEILSKSYFDLSGYTPASIGRDDVGGPGMGGHPGEAGKEGAKGKKGSNAGNCDKIRVFPGRTGYPKYRSQEWYNWNLGYGNHSSQGKGGVYSKQDLDDISSLVFVDPESPMSDKKK